MLARLALLVELLEAVLEAATATGRADSLWLAPLLPIAGLADSCAMTPAPATVRRLLVLDAAEAVAASSAALSTGLAGFLSLVDLRMLGLGSGLTGPDCGGVIKMSFAD